MAVLVTLPTVPTIFGPGIEPVSAATLSYDDVLTLLGVDNVQDALEALYALANVTSTPTGSGTLDFSSNDDSGWLGAI